MLQKFTKRLSLVSLLFANAMNLSAASKNYISTMEHNSIRALYCNNGQLCDALIERAFKNRYNYAIVEFDFRITDNIVGNKDVYNNLGNDVKNACVLLSKREMRLIPMFQMSSQWSLGWKTLRDFENPDIGINSITCNRENPQLVTNAICNYTDNLSTVNEGSNSWAPEPNGVDKSIIEVFDAIKQGFSDANVNYPLEFIHIGHDEPQFLNWCIIAGIGSECETAYPYKGNLARGESSQADINYIQTKINAGLSTQSAYQMLLADELYRRVSQAEQVYGTNVKIMIYGDSYDNQSWGGVPLWIQKGYGDKITLSGAIDLPGLTESQKSKVKERIIPILWNYHGKVERADNPLDFLTRSDYNSNEAINRFVSRGFKVMYCGALQNGNDSKNQIKEYSSTSHNYRNNCLGYCAAAWVDTYDPNLPDNKWSVIEYIYTGCGNDSYLPVTDFTRRTENYIQSLMQLLLD